ncbi:MAG: phage holin family protein [Candidatus Uhrbacteria bacterium]|nr:phage holin family protein [Candidatus Uhrbacteria bacterium]
MLFLIIRLVLNALALIVVASVIPGIVVSDFPIALLAAVVIGLVNALVRPLIELLSLPITVLTLGLFSLVINALMFGLAAWITPGFSVDGFGPAFWGGLLYAVLATVISWLVKEKGRAA